MIPSAFLRAAFPLPEHLHRLTAEWFLQFCLLCLEGNQRCGLLRTSTPRGEESGWGGGGKGGGRDSKR